MSNQDNCDNSKNTYIRNIPVAPKTPQKVQISSAKSQAFREYYDAIVYNQEAEFFKNTNGHI